VLAATYRKIHLYDVEIPGRVSYLESATVAAGSDPVTVDVDGVRVGLSICYDLRFPELYRRLADAGARVLVVPAAFMLHTGRDHWEVLLRARAIENQCYVLAAAQIGDHEPGRTCYGRSMVVDPWGTVLVQAPDEVGVTVVDLDLDRLATIRAELPSLANRRL
jgi:predicted amidohydrolase